MSDMRFLKINMLKNSKNAHGGWQNANSMPITY